MAVLADETGMNSEDSNHKNESSHSSNLYFDRQLQNKLLQVDEDSDNEVYESKLSRSWTNLKTGGKPKSETRIEDINGWFPSAKFVGRKNEIIKTEPKPANNFIHPWKDYRTKKDESFVFKHYTEFRKYIEQYRSQHGCHINRFPSGNQVGEMRRTAFQNSAPPQQTSVTVQQLHQSGFVNSAPPSSCNGNHHSNVHYTNRKEQLGTLVTTASNCTCNTKTNSADSSSQSQKYKVIPGQFSRTHTSYDLRHADSDNSSECGDLRYRTPSRRTNSASSTRSRTITGKSPTKITVPANPNTRAYPVQALTIQQNGKADSCPSPKPLDNLNCVAPEKQPTVIDRKNVDPNLELALKVHSLNDLLTTHEAPLRGYALPKSMPPNPNPNNGEGSECSDTDSDDLLSLDQLSTCPLSADPRSRKLDYQSQHLQKFLKEDPMLSSLNQKPELRPGTSERQNLSAATQLFNSDTFLIPKNDVDAMLRVNMWNPILSMPPNGPRRDLASQQFKSLMSQSPFRVIDERVRSHNSVETEVKTSYQEKIDYFNPMKKVQLSITRLDNAVSFCRTRVQNLKSGEKRSVSRATNSATSQNGKGENIGEQVSFKMKPPIFDPFVGKLTKPSKFEQKFNMPVPPVKILESIPVDKILKSSGAGTPCCVASQSSPRSSTGHKQVMFSNHQSTTSDTHNPTNNQSQLDNSTQLAKGNRSVKLIEDQCTKEEVDKPVNQINGSCINMDKSCELEVSMANNHHVDGKVKGTNVERDTRSKEAEKDDPKDSNGKEAIEGLMGTKMNIDNRTKTEKFESKTVKVSGKKLLKKPSVASGKCLRSHPELDGLTWAEKLEVLRSVNKPRDKPKNRQQKLKFVKADPKDPVYMWSFEHDQLYEQRRIKHLVEQARIKGGKQFDWVYEAQIKSRDIDRDIEKAQELEGAASGESSDDEGAAGDKNLGKYGICVPPKSVKQRLFNVHGINKSNTYIAP